MKTEEAWNGLYSVGGGDDDDDKSKQYTYNRTCQHGYNIVFEWTRNNNPVSLC